MLTKRIMGQKKKKGKLKEVSAYRQKKKVPFYCCLEKQPSSKKKLTTKIINLGGNSGYQLNWLIIYIYPYLYLCLSLYLYEVEYIKSRKKLGA